MGDKPLITVALPLWSAGDIAWLCLESLCAQKTTAPWELIVCEEPKPNPFGIDRIEAYINRLRDAGMVDLNYVVQDKRIRLARKWRKIAEYSSESSLVYQMCGADNYYQKNMLQQGYDAIINGADWFSTYECHFYDIKTGKLVRYFNKRYSGIEMSTKTEYMRNLPGSNKGKGIDLYVLRSVDPQAKEWNDSGDGYNTVCTHGRNTISWNRGPLINNVRRPFVEADAMLEDLLPVDIVNRLRCL